MSQTKNGTLNKQSRCKRESINAYNVSESYRQYIINVELAHCQTIAAVKARLTNNVNCIIVMTSKFMNVIKPKGKRQDIVDFYVIS